METLTIREVITKKEMRQFICLPWQVHRNNKAWMPPLYSDEWILFDPRKNKSFKHSDTVLYLAFRGKKPVGRVMGIINRLYNDIHNEQHGRFSFMECYEDQEVVHALLQKIEQWAREKGMVKLVGPLGFSDKDPQGFVIEGFGYPQFLASATNDPYLPEMVGREGYEKKVDLVNYLLPMPEKLPEVYERILERFNNNSPYRVKEFNTKKELKPYIIPALDVMNQTYTEIYGFTPLDDQEKKELADRYLPILDPHFIKIIEHGDEVVAFAVAMPDPSEGIKKAGGKLLPFGIFHIIREIKRTKILLTMLGGIKTEHREQGIDVLMAIKLYESAIKYGMKMVNSHLILETNTRMRGEFERVGGTVTKKFRIYQKDLVR